MSQIYRLKKRVKNIIQSMV